jgi:hypothetical protein
VRPVLLRRLAAYKKVVRTGTTMEFLLLFFIRKADGNPAKIDFSWGVEKRPLDSLLL